MFAKAVAVKPGGVTLARALRLLERQEFHMAAGRGMSLSGPMGTNLAPLETLPYLKALLQHWSGDLLLPCPHVWGNLDGHCGLGEVARVRRG